MAERQHESAGPDIFSASAPELVIWFVRDPHAIVSTLETWLDAFDDRYRLDEEGNVYPVSDADPNDYELQAAMFKIASAIHIAAHEPGGFRAMASSPLVLTPDRQRNSFAGLFDCWDWVTVTHAHCRDVLAYQEQRAPKPPTKPPYGLIIDWDKKTIHRSGYMRQARIDWSRSSKKISVFKQILATDPKPFPYRDGTPQSRSELKKEMNADLAKLDIRVVKGEWKIEPVEFQNSEE